MKLQLTVITIMILCTMTLISSTSKHHEVDGNKNPQNMEELLDLNQNQRQYEQSLQDQQDTFEKLPNKTSHYNGVSWHKTNKKWQTQLIYNNKKCYGGYFNDEKQAAMKVNLLCDKYGKKRKNPMVDLEPDAMQQGPNQTSKYNGVCWHKDAKKWQTRLLHKKKRYQGGYFDNEIQAAMNVNLLCDKCGIERKNPMIIIKSDEIQQVSNQTSKYNGVYWHKDAKKWKAQLVHKKKMYYGGYFDNEEHAAMQVNLFCDNNGIERKNSMIVIDQDLIQKIPNQSSKYTGACWHKVLKKWQAQLVYKKKSYYGGYFDDEEHAAMRVNLLCDTFDIARKNPMINIKADVIQKLLKNQTSIYTGVCWHKDSKKWLVRLVHNKKSYLGGLFDNEEQAAMKVNLLCDKNGIERKNPMIIIEPDKMQQVPNQTSKYTGVCWHKDFKKWQSRVIHKNKAYYGGYFDNEEQAAMKVNLLCDKNGIEHKNLMIIIESDHSDNKTIGSEHANYVMGSEVVKTDDSDNTKEKKRKSKQKKTPFEHYYFYDEMLKK